MGEGGREGGREGVRVNINSLLVQSSQVHLHKSQ